MICYQVPLICLGFFFKYFILFISFILQNVLTFFRIGVKFSLTNIVQLTFVAITLKKLHSISNLLNDQDAQQEVQRLLQC